MKKVLTGTSRTLTLILICSILLVGVQIIFAPPTYASTAQNFSQKTPNGSGGGCTGMLFQGHSYAYAKYSSCISESFFQQVNPDAYFTFGAANAGLWSQCTVTIKLYDYTTNQFINSVSINCLSAARSNKVDVHYYGSSSTGVSGHGYITFTCWSGVYNVQTIWGECLESPIQWI